MKNEKHLNKTNLATIVMYPQAGHRMDFHLLVSLSVVTYQGSILGPQILSHAMELLHKNIRDIDTHHVVYNKINR